jgi:hypothetical protein
MISSEQVGGRTDQEIYRTALKATTAKSVEEHILRMTPKAQSYVREKPFSQQFPACIPGSFGLLGATTNNWAEQEMELLKHHRVRRAPNLFAALTMTVEYSARTYSKNYDIVHSQKGEVIPEFAKSYELAEKRANQEDQPTRFHEAKYCRLRSATDANVEYESRLTEGGSGCSCGTFKTTGKFCWHFAQHCRVSSMDPWQCKLMKTLFLCKTFSYFCYCIPSRRRRCKNSREDAKAKLRNVPI